MALHATPLFELGRFSYVSQFEGALTARTQQEAFFGRCRFIRGTNIVASAETVFSQCLFEAGSRVAGGTLEHCYLEAGARVNGRIVSRERRVA